MERQWLNKPSGRITLIRKAPRQYIDGRLRAFAKRNGSAKL